MRNSSHPVVVQVAVKVPFADQLDYQLPEDMTPPEVGMRVRVPLGKNHQRVGLVVGLSQHSDHKNLRAISQILDESPLFLEPELTLLRQAAKYYQVTLGELVFTALPAWFRKPENRPIPVQRWWRTTSGPDAAEDSLRSAPSQLEVFNYLHRHGPLQSRDLSHINAAAAKLCRELQAKGLAESAELCFVENDAAKDPGFELTEDQAKALHQLTEHQDQFATHLLDGITGSGKTEVYIRFIQQQMDQGRQALVLVPEIGLTPQLFQEISQRINGHMAILHSGLSDGARARVWQQAAKGLVDVVVATRSGIFTPFKKLGAVLVDEEHDLSYKQQEGIRYSARDLAILRGKIHGVPVVLGSATPSFESLNHAINGRYCWLKLRSRTNHSPMPSLTLQNTESKKLNKGLSQATMEAIEQHLSDGNQVLVFLNRRGWSPKLMCHDCGWVAECDDCDAYLTYHKQLDLLKCHHCDRRYSIPEFCPQCGSQEVATMGVGTEKIAAGLSEHFGAYPVVRFDRDAVKTPAQWQANLEAIRTNQPCVIVGTQMLSKGHDFPRLSLVVVANVDNSFFSSDFRATEYLAQLLIQVSGRAGRAKTKGQVIIQTQFPEHEFFQTLFRHDYQTFAQDQLTQRDEMRFPPHTHMAIIRGQHRQQQPLDQGLQQLAKQLELQADISVLGPIPAPMQKKQRLHRMQLILNSNDRKSLHRALHQIKHHDPPLAGQVNWFVDIDPVTFD